MFENFGKKVKGYSDSLRQSAQGFSESVTINNQIRELSHECDELYVKIGTAFYDQYQDNVPQAFAEDFQAIREKRAQIDSLRESLRQAKGIWVCETCGAENPSDAVFCARCGTKRPVQQVNQSSGGVVAGYCPQCGSPYSKDDVFCGNCGYRLSAPDTSNVSDSQTMQSQQQNQHPAQDAQPAWQTAQSSQMNQQAQQSSQMNQQTQQSPQFSANDVRNDTFGSASATPVFHDRNEDAPAFHDNYREKPAASGSDDFAEQSYHSVYQKAEMRSEAAKPEENTAETEDDDVMTQQTRLYFPERSENREPPETGKETEWSAPQPETSSAPEQSIPQPESSQIPENEFLANADTSTNADSNEVRFCPNCGAKLEPDSIFCAECGTRVR